MCPHTETRVGSTRWLSMNEEIMRAPKQPARSAPVLTASRAGVKTDDNPAPVVGHYCPLRRRGSGGDKATQTNVTNYANLLSPDSGGEPTKRLRREHRTDRRSSIRRAGKGNPTR